MNPRIPHQPCTPAISIIVKVKHPLSAMFNPLHKTTNQELFIKHLYNPHIPKERNGERHHFYINYHLKSEVSIMLHCQLCSTRYTASQIKNCPKSTSAIKVATMINTDDLHYKRKPSHDTAKLMLFTVSKDEWDTKEDTSKSMKNALYVLWYAKRHLRGQSNIEQQKKIKPVALAVSISQSVSD